LTVGIIIDISGQILIVNYCDPIIGGLVVIVDPLIVDDSIGIVIIIIIGGIVN